MHSYFEQFCKKRQNFRGLGKPLKVNIFQKYFTHGVFRVNGTLWQGKNYYSIYLSYLIMIQSEITNKVLICFGYMTI